MKPWKPNKVILVRSIRSLEKDPSGITTCTYLYRLLDQGKLRKESVDWYFNTAEAVAYPPDWRRKDAVH